MCSSDLRRPFEEYARHFFAQKKAAPPKSLEAEVPKLLVNSIFGKTVSTVEDGTEEVETSALWNGERTVLLTVRKQSGTNTVALTKAIRERAAEIQPRLPAGFTLDVIRDTSEVTQTSVHAVQEHLIVGAILAALVDRKSTRLSSHT